MTPVIALGLLGPFEVDHAITPRRRSRRSSASPPNATPSMGWTDERGLVTFL
jgi:hypothetical protein